MKKDIIILCICTTVLSSVVSAVVSTAISGHHKRPPFEQNIRNNNKFNQSAHNNYQQDFEKKDFYRHEGEFDE